MDKIMLMLLCMAYNITITKLLIPIACPNKMLFIPVVYHSNVFIKCINHNLHYS